MQAFENQKLLSDQYQIHLLDHFARQGLEVLQYQEKLCEFKKLKKEIELLLNSKTSRNQRLDYLNYQLDEIEKLNPTSMDEEDLLRKKTLMMGFEKTQKICYQAKSYLEGDDDKPGVLDQFKNLNQLFKKNYDQFEDLSDLLIEIEDKVQSLLFNIDKKLILETDPNELEKILERIDDYQRIKKKFGGSVVSIL